MSSCAFESSGGGGRSGVRARSARPLPRAEGKKSDAATFGRSGVRVGGRVGEGGGNARATPRRPSRRLRAGRPCASSRPEAAPRRASRASRASARPTRPSRSRRGAHAVPPLVARASTTSFPNDASSPPRSPPASRFERPERANATGPSPPYTLSPSPRPRPRSPRRRAWECGRRRGATRSEGGEKKTETPRARSASRRSRGGLRVCEPSKRAGLHDTSA